MLCEQLWVAELLACGHPPILTPPLLAPVKATPGLARFELTQRARARQQYVDSKGAGLGSVYIKGLYREYTDASFSTRKLANPQHGILGPILHAHVGDTLVIVFTVGHLCCACCTGLCP